MQESKYESTEIIYILIK